MKLNRIALAHRMVKEESGQTLLFVSLIMVAFLGLAGMSMDAGHGFYAYELLQQSTNAATLAGAAGLPNQTTATTYVTNYSAATGDRNAPGGIMYDVVATPSFKCLTTVTNTLHVPCETATGGSGGVNAVQVTQTAKVNTWIGQFFGVPVLNISATSTASMAGGPTTPYSVAIVEDTTASMADKDSGKNCSGTQITCALQGIQDLLLNMDPCAVGITCTGSSSYVDNVSLYVFPALTAGASNLAKDTTCPSSNPSTVPYTFSNVTTTSPNYNMATTLGTYQVINYSNNYKTTDAATTLNASSALAIAVGSGACSGISAPGGEGTYYAQVIYAAAANLLTAQAANPGSKMAMIILSDGNATACNTATSTGNDCSGSGSSQIVATTGTLNGTGTKTSNPTGYESPTYPSALGECGQAVAAAQAATQEGIRVYTIGYGAETSGCTTDSKYSTAGNANYGGGSWGAGNSPCEALAAMASTGSQFFSDDGDGCAATNSANQAYTTIPSIMQAVYSSWTSSRLIPNGTT